MFRQDLNHSVLIHGRGEKSLGILMRRTRITGPIYMQYMMLQLVSIYWYHENKIEVYIQVVQLVSG